MSSNLRITVSEEKGKVPVTILHIMGDLDANSQADFESQAQQIVDGGANNILLDLSEVSYMGSAGLRVIHSLSGKLKEGDTPGAVKLLSPSESVSKVLKTLGFDSYFEVFQSPHEAVASF